MSITIAAVRWADVTPGVRLRIGEVLCQVSAYGPISRVDATVLTPGTIRSDDTVVLEP